LEALAFARAGPWAVPPHALALLLQSGLKKKDIEKQSLKN
jgi:hypothetical protein